MWLRGRAMARRRRSKAARTMLRQRDGDVLVVAMSTPPTCWATTPPADDALVVYDRAAGRVKAQPMPRTSRPSRSD